MLLRRSLIGIKGTQQTDDDTGTDNVSTNPYVCRKMISMRSKKLDTYYNRGYIKVLGVDYKKWYEDDNSIYYNIDKTKLNEILGYSANIKNFIFDLRHFEYKMVSSSNIIETGTQFRIKRSIVSLPIFYNYSFDGMFKEEKYVQLDNDGRMQCVPLGSKQKLPLTIDLDKINRSFALMEKEITPIRKNRIAIYKNHKGFRKRIGIKKTADMHSYFIYRGKVNTRKCNARIKVFDNKKHYISSKGHKIKKKGQGVNIWLKGNRYIYERSEMIHGCLRFGGGFGKPLIV